MKARTLRHTLDESARLGLPLVELLSPQPYIVTRYGKIKHTSARCQTVRRSRQDSIVMVVPADLPATQCCNRCPETLPAPARQEHALLSAVLRLEAELRRKPTPSRGSLADSHYVSELCASVHLILAQCPTPMVAAFSVPFQALMDRAVALVNTESGGVLEGPLTHVVALPDFHLIDPSYPLSGNGCAVLAGLGHYVSDPDARAGYALVTDAGFGIIARGYWHPNVVELLPGDDRALPVALAYLGGDRSFSSITGRHAAAMITALKIARCVTAPATV